MKVFLFFLLQLIYYSTTIAVEPDSVYYKTKVNKIIEKINSRKHLPNSLIPLWDAFSPSDKQNSWQLNLIRDSVDLFDSIVITITIHKNDFSKDIDIVEESYISAYKREIWGYSINQEGKIILGYRKGLAENNFIYEINSNFSESINLPDSTYKKASTDILKQYYSKAEIIVNELYELLFLPKQ